MKNIEALAHEVRATDIARKSLSWELCRDLAEAVGRVEEYDAIQIQPSDSAEVKVGKYERKYHIAEYACIELHISRHGAAMVWVHSKLDNIEAYWDFEEEILDDKGGIWRRIAEAIHADQALEGTARLKAIRDFQGSSLYDVYVEEV